MEATQILEQLEELARRNIPYDKKLWDIHLIADYLGYSIPHVRDKIIPLPSFPKPLAIGAGKRWKAQDVIDWAEGQNQPVRSRGRPRKRV